MGVIFGYLNASKEEGKPELGIRGDGFSGSKSSCREASVSDSVRIFSPGK